MDGRCVRCMRYGRIGGQREKVRGVYGFSSLVKQNKKGKNSLSFASPEKENYFFNICDVITSPEKEKSSVNHYFHGTNFHQNPVGTNKIYFFFFISLTRLAEPFSVTCVTPGGHEYHSRISSFYNHQRFCIFSLRVLYFYHESV